MVWCSRSAGPIASSPARSTTTEPHGRACPPALCPSPRSVSREPDEAASRTTWATSAGERGRTTPAGEPRSTCPKSSATAATARSDACMLTPERSHAPPPSATPPNQLTPALAPARLAGRHMPGQAGLALPVARLSCLPPLVRPGIYLILMVRILKFLVNETPSVPAAPSKRPVPPVTANTADSGCWDLKATIPWTVRLPVAQTVVTTQLAKVWFACLWGIRVWGILVRVHTPASWPTIG